MNLDELTDRMVSISSNDYTTATQLMVECLRIIPFQLPPVALTGIDLARRYWIDGSVPKDETERLRIECWSYLDAQSASTNTEEPEFCAIRAVICVLYADPEADDIGDMVDFFNQMLRNALKNDSDEVFFEKVGSIVDEFAEAHN